MIATNMIYDVLGSISIVGIVGILIKIIWDNRLSRFNKLEEGVMTKEVCNRNHLLENERIISLEKRLDEIQRENKERHQDIKEQLNNLSDLVRSAITFRKRESDRYE